jgi:starch synthase
MKAKVPIRVLMAFSEVSPYAKTGGLADVGSALPPALNELGCDVRVVMPYYKQFVEEKVGKEIVVENLPVPLGTEVIYADVYRAQLNGGVPVYLIRRDEFFDRSHLYGTRRGDYFDNFQRFTYFSRAVLSLCPAVKFKPDVVHAHDWQCGLIPAYLTHIYGQADYWTGTVSVFTIHNIVYQGQFSAELYYLTGLPSSFFGIAGMEFWGGINFLKAAIVSAGVVTTVSLRYSKEIQTREYGHGLEGVLHAHREKLYGILNGVDYEKWNPETDPYIAANYSWRTLEGKKLCKVDLLRTAQLSARLVDRPLLGMISRLADQKGLELVAAVMEKLVAQDVGLVFLGTGDDIYHNMLTELADRYPGKIAVRLAFDEQLAHKIEAGVDMFLMPSRYEPCGLNQMYSLRYGTVPIVRATGGLYDTVKPFNPKHGKGVGFRFSEYTPESFWRAINRALNLFSKPETWRQIMQNGMATDFSWSLSARHYLELYEKTLAQRRQAAKIQRSEVGGRRSEVRGQRTEDSRQRAAGRARRHGDGGTRGRGE